jgi:hypothetical protein
MEDSIDLSARRGWKEELKTPKNTGKDVCFPE